MSKKVDEEKNVVVIMILRQRCKMKTGERLALVALNSIVVLDKNGLLVEENL